MFNINARYFTTKLLIIIINKNVLHNVHSARINTLLQSSTTHHYPSRKTTKKWHTHPLVIHNLSLFTLRSPTYLYHTTWVDPVTKWIKKLTNSCLLCRLVGSMRYHMVHLQRATFKTGPNLLQNSLSYIVVKSRAATSLRKGGEGSMENKKVLYN